MNALEGLIIWGIPHMYIIHNNTATVVYKGLD